jgi:hypothetical protein
MIYRVKKIINYDILKKSNLRCNLKTILFLTSRTALAEKNNTGEGRSKYKKPNNMF